MKETEKDKSDDIGFIAESFVEQKEKNMNWEQVEDMVGEYGADAIEQGKSICGDEPSGFLWRLDGETEWKYTDDLRDIRDSLDSASEQLAEAQVLRENEVWARRIIKARKAEVILLKKTPRWSEYDLSADFVVNHRTEVCREEDTDGQEVEIGEKETGCGDAEDCEWRQIDSHSLRDGRVVSGEYCRKCHYQFTYIWDGYGNFQNKPIEEYLEAPPQYLDSRDFDEEEE